MAPQMTLTEKVLAVFNGEGGFDPGPVAEFSAAVPFRGDDDYEYALVDWHIMYGIAVGLARTEEVCEPLESVAARARQAACEAFLKYDDQRVGASQVRTALEDCQREAVA